MLEYEEWCDANEHYLLCAAAELGADRELDFDPEVFAEKQYEKYLKEGGNQ